MHVRNWTARRVGVAGLNVAHFAVPELSDDGAPYLPAVAVGTGIVIFAIGGAVLVRRGQERCVVALAARGVGHPRLIVGTDALALAIRIRARRLRSRRAGIRAGRGQRLG